MSHTNPQSLRWRQRQTVKLLQVLEGIALRVLPRGPVRKRLLERVDLAMKQIHIDRCG